MKLIPPEMISAYWKTSLLFFALTLCSGAEALKAASFPVLPELQLYHSLGTEGSSYSTIAAGTSIHLNANPSGPERFLQLLLLHVPQKVADIKGNLGKLTMETDGKGIELAVHDQWASPAGKGATLSLRHISWDQSSDGNEIFKDVSTDVLHMGWNWASGGASVIVWMFGFDLASIHYPWEHRAEVRFALGSRTAF